MAHKNLIFVLFLLVLTTVSCKKKSEDSPPVNPPVKPPVDTLYVNMTGIGDISTDGATYFARRYGASSLKINEYGFVWSDSTQLPSPTDFIQPFQGSPDSIFSFRVDKDLEAGRTFFVRAYLKTGDSMIYSQVKSFVSLGCKPPVITAFYPDSACGGRFITIIGKNFSVKSHHNNVLFGTIQGTIVHVSADTILVMTPNTTLTRDVNITVEVAKQSAISVDLFRHICPWSDLPMFPGEARFWNSAFTIGSKGYVCLGHTGMNSLASPKLWEYDMNANSWQEKQPFPVEQRSRAIGFSINGKGYVGLGENLTYYLFKDLWQYDPVTDSWQQKSSFPGVLKLYVDPPSCVVIDNKMYMYLPSDQSFWEYDPATDRWTAMPFNNALKGKWVWEGLNWNNRGFFLETDGVSYKSNFILWEYLPSTNQIMMFDSVVTSNDAKSQGSFIIGDRLYIPLMGYKMLEYDLNTKFAFNHNSPVDVYDFNTVFVYQKRAFLGKSENTDMYQFYPR
jgi:hypothetical protein